MLLYSSWKYNTCCSCIPCWIYNSVTLQAKQYVQCSWFLRESIPMAFGFPLQHFNVQTHGLQQSKVMTTGLIPIWARTCNKFFFLWSSSRCQSRFSVVSPFSLSFPFVFPFFSWPGIVYVCMCRLWMNTLTPPPTPCGAHISQKTARLQYLLSLRQHTHACLIGGETLPVQPSQVGRQMSTRVALGIQTWSSF